MIVKGVTAFKKNYVRLLLIGLGTATFFMVTLDWNMDKSVLRTSVRKAIRIFTMPRRIKTEDVKDEDKYLIDTPGCRIPRTKIMPEYFTEWETYDEPTCTFEKKIAILDYEKEILTLLPEFKNSDMNCNISEIVRRTDDDNEFDLVEAEFVEGSLNVSKIEIMVTRCGTHANFEAHFPINDSVQQKLDHWSKLKENPSKSPNSTDPISVILIGFDTTSRSHVHRSLPKTLALMRDLNFFDFQGFHSVCPYTNDNFNAFLMGLETEEMRATCAESWSDFYDNCSLIWQNFRDNNYVTMYAEDGSQTFNWGGGGGFSKKPTDYYVHPMYKAIANIREQILGDYSEFRHPCASTVGVPEYQLNYLQRFANKFANVPTFAFAFFGNPFHDKTYSLSYFDGTMEKFFKFLKSAPNILEDTLIIMLADHGERNGDFVTKGYEGFIEKSAPALFLRLPDKLREMFPEFEESLRENTKRLTTAFDVHHTFLHLLHIGGFNYASVNGNETFANFEPIRHDRSSLLVPIDDKRSCLTVPIRHGNCICNSTFQGQGVENPFLLNKLYSFVVDDLNQLIDNSSYSKDCDGYRRLMLPIVSAHVTAQEGDRLDTIFRFTPNPEAEFEVRVRVWEKNGTIEKVERMSHYQRVDLYKETSWCVRKETTEDKVMAELCYCEEKSEEES